uniref:Mitochondrial antiviral-signaling protein n=1 Tax=Clandestinovirus TaxID=2831644 RepID=A0A8F8PK68_9VIRU|nr:mitochondrial antiviral-signaling protein [Clandestinovirus]
MSNLNENVEREFKCNFIFTLNRMVFNVDENMYKRLAQQVGWENISMLSTHFGHGNEVASLIDLLQKQLGKNGLRKFYDALEMTENPKMLEVQQSIRDSVCSGLFL